MGLFFFFQDLTSVQNMQKKHGLLEADVVAHAVMPGDLSHLLVIYNKVCLCVGGMGRGVIACSL